MVAGRPNTGDILDSLQSNNKDLGITRDDVKKLAEKQLIALEVQDKRVLEDLHKALDIQTKSKDVIETKNAAERLHIAVHQENFTEYPLMSPTYGAHSSHYLMDDLKKTGIQSPLEMNDSLRKIIDTAAKLSQETLEAQIIELTNRSYRTINIDNRAINIAIL